jgi:N utilization substance protein A
MSGEIEQAVKTICEEKGISMEAVLGTIEAALAAAYRKDFAEKYQNIKVKFDLKTGGSEVFDVKTVVEDQPEEVEEPEDQEQKEHPEQKEVKTKDGEEEEVKKFNPKTDLEITEAKKIKKDAKIGDEIITKLDVPEAYGRMAAQTAKQVIIQKLREAERDTQFEEFKDREHDVVMGTVQRRDMRNVYVDIGRITAIMPKDEQIERESYRTGDRIKVYIMSVDQSNRGPEVIVSRSSNEIVEAVFRNEIPEIANEVIEIKSVAREAGSRSKVAVHTDDSNIDPIGSCVGQRGTRVQTIISELGGEKIDIIQYDEDPKAYIANALSPAKPVNIDINEEGKTATVSVEDDQLSLAIGRAGQNVRLASKLTGWNINIKSNESGEVIDPDKEDLQDSGDKDDDSVEKQDPKDSKNNKEPEDITTDKESKEVEDESQEEAKEDSKSDKKAVEEPDEKKKSEEK